jgi:hypothetical protein
LPIRTEKQDALQVAMMAYVIGMAACLEIFFRDLYLHVLERDPRLTERTLALNMRRDGDTAINRYLASGVAISEHAAAQVSFQSTEAIDRNFSKFFADRTFFESTGPLRTLLRYSLGEATRTSSDEALSMMARLTSPSICIASRICLRWQLKIRNRRSGKEVAGDDSDSHLPDHRIPQTIRKWGVDSSDAGVPVLW